MKYFTPELIAAANDWVEQSEEERQQVEARLGATVEDYHKELDTLMSRISRSAYQFFRFGYGHQRLHDARLLSLQVGDGLDYSPDGKAPFRLNHQRASARVEFLNYEQDLHYLFSLRSLKRMRGDLYVEEMTGRKYFGDLFAYELTGAETGDLQFGLLFASGATIIFQFQKLVFRRRRITRTFSLDEAYQ